MLNKQQIKSSSIPILKKNGVTKAALFGSFVRGDNTETSDIDFLVEFENGKSLFELVSRARQRKIDQREAKRNL